MAAYERVTLNRGGRNSRFNCMNMFARFDENPAMTLRVIKETKRYGRTDARTHGRTDNVKTVYPLQTKFAGGIIMT